TESRAIMPASEADLPALAELAGVIWRAHYPESVVTDIGGGFVMDDFVMARISVRGETRAHGRFLPVLAPPLVRLLRFPPCQFLGTKSAITRSSFHAI